MTETSLAVPSARFTPATFSDADLAELNARFERLPASAIIAWAARSFGPYLSLAASMETRSVMKAGAPASACSSSDVTVPLTSASQLAGRCSSLSTLIAPHAAQPSSVKNSGQQRTATPDSCDASISVRSA